MSSVVFAGISFEVPEGVTATVEDGRLDLSFLNYTGLLSVHPCQGSPEAFSQPFKRARLETPTEKRDDDVLAADDRRDVLAQHTEVFRNGGLSQEDSVDGSQPPEPRFISWEDIAMDREEGDTRGDGWSEGLHENGAQEPSAIGSGHRGRHPTIARLCAQNEERLAPRKTRFRLPSRPPYLLQCSRAPRSVHPTYDGQDLALVWFRAQ